MMAAKTNTRKSKRNGQLLPGIKSDSINMQVRLLPTSEVFPLRRISLLMKVSELKSQLEYITGVPVNLQRLHYLDEGDLMDDSVIKKNDFVPGATVQMDVWHVYRDLFLAAAKGDAEKVLRLGVTADSTYNTPNSLYMKGDQRQQWLRERALLALYVAAHRGHLALCQRLIRAGADVNGRTPLGRGPLHVVAAQGHGDLVDLLLENGADINAVDSSGKSALDVAGEYGHKACERHLFLFRWQVRARDTRSQYLDPPLMAHQYHDSAFPVWKAGPVAQVYLQNILPPGEYQGSAMHAPRSTTAEQKQNHLLYGSAYNERQKSPDTRTAKTYVGFGSPPDAGASTLKKMNFNEWLKKKQKAEQILINKRKAEEQRKQEHEEDKKRAAEEKQESYETWLANQQGADSAAKKETGKSKGRRGLKPAGEAGAAPEKEAPGAETRRKVAAVSFTVETSRDHRLKTDRERSVYEDWLQRKEQEVLEDIVNKAPVIDTLRFLKAT